ncbi:hypothetical protein [Bacteroidetes bacterium endosymbiont of Geopemphigus sp.]
MAGACKATGTALIGGETSESRACTNRSITMWPVFA